MSRARSVLLDSARIGCCRIVRSNPWPTQLARYCCKGAASSLLINLLGGFGTHGADVRHDLPDLVLGDLASKCWHPVWPAFQNGFVDIRRPIAIDPVSVDERRSDGAASAGAVAAGAVVPGKQALSLVHRIIVAFV